MQDKVKKRIVVVDDHPLVRAGLVQLIESRADMEVCGEAESVGQALSLIEEQKPDAALIDLSLKDGSGLELVKQIDSVHPEVRMLVVSRHDEALYAERAIHAGASGYVGKDVAAEVVIGALERVLDGKVYVSEAISDRLLQGLSRSGEAPVESPVERLSDRELEVFELIGEGETTRSIADKLHLSVKTVETHRESIKHKMNLASGNELIRAAVQWSLERS